MPEGTRVYAIGDVHGRSDLLAERFRAIDAHALAHPVARAIVVLLGDYVDRGPGSREVIDLILARQRSGEVVALRGNHEEMFLRFLRDPSALREWLSFGGLQTLFSYYSGREEPLPTGLDLAVFLDEARALVPDGHIRFLKELKVSYRCGDYMFVHAGVRPGVPLEDQDPRDLLWIRDDFLSSHEEFGAVIVHGHTPVDRPDLRVNRINIDTGAYLTGRLTCLVLDGEGARILPWDHGDPGRDGSGGRAQ